MQSPKVHSLELNWGSHNLIESSCPSDYSTFSWPLPSTCCCDYSHTMPNSPDITLLDSNFSPPSAYCPIYLSLPFSRKQTLLSVVDTSQQITCQTTDDLTLSLPPDYISWLWLTHTHTMIWLFQMYQDNSTKITILSQCQSSNSPEDLISRFRVGSDNLCIIC